jgi:Domain of unknown function (DUF892)
MAKSPKRLDELFHDTLKDIYLVEKKILSNLPKMAPAAQRRTESGVREASAETEGHMARLEQVFAAINQKPHGKACAAIVGIADEGAEIMEELLSMPDFSQLHRPSNTTKSPVTARFAPGPKSWDSERRIDPHGGKGNR